MKNSVRKDHTLHKIYDAVQTLLTEKGNDMSVKDICQYAGIGVGTLNHYYPSKEDAIFDISNPIDVYFKQTVIPALQNHSAKEQLELYFMYQAQFMSDYVLVNGQSTFLKAIQSNLQHFFSEDRLTFTILKDIVCSPELYQEWKKTYSSDMITWHLLCLAHGDFLNLIDRIYNFLKRKKTRKYFSNFFLHFLIF